MFVRMSTSEGTPDIDAVVAELRDQVTPQVVGQEGFRAITANADRSTGHVSVLTLWDTEQHLKASDSVGKQVRKRAAKATGARIQEVQVFEQLVWVTGEKLPVVGCPVSVISTQMDPATIDDNIAFFRSNVLPEIKATKGFRALRNMVNRQTGEGMVASAWDDDAALTASIEGFAKRRAAGEARGITFGDPLRREIIFSSSK